MGTVIVKDQDNNPIAGAIAPENPASPSVFIFTPDANLPLGATISTDVTTGVKSADGIALPAEVDESFQTVAAPTAPNLVGITPNNGATNVPVDAVIRLEFDHVMDPTTVTVG